MILGLRDRAFVRETFGKYMSSQVSEAILSGDLKLGGERRMVTLLCEQVPGQHVGLQTEDMQAVYASMGFAPQPQFMSRVVGRWLDNDANR